MTRGALGPATALQGARWKSVQGRASQELSETSQELSGTFWNIQKFEMFLGDSEDRLGRGRWKTVLDASKTFEMFSDILKILDVPRVSEGHFRDGRWKCVLDGV